MVRISRFTCSSYYYRVDLLLYIWKRNMHKPHIQVSNRAFKHTKFAHSRIFYIADFFGVYSSINEQHNLAKLFHVCRRPIHTILSAHLYSSLADTSMPNHVTRSSPENKRVHEKTSCHSERCSTAYGIPTKSQRMG